MEPSGGGDGEQRFAVVAATRYLVPLAVVVGVVTAIFFDGPVARAVCLWGSVALATLALLAERRRTVLVVGAAGYRVERRGRAELTVAWHEVVRAFGVPDEEAAYLDTGESAKNLLLPPRHGYGFRFARQGDLYAAVARALGDRLVVVPSLEAALDGQPPPPAPPSPPNGVQRP